MTTVTSLDQYIPEWLIANLYTFGAKVQSVGLHLNEKCTCVYKTLVTGFRVINLNIFSACHWAGVCTNRIKWSTDQKSKSFLDQSSIIRVISSVMRQIPSTCLPDQVLWKYLYLELESFLKNSMSNSNFIFYSLFFKKQMQLKNQKDFMFIDLAFRRTGGPF